MTRPFGRKLQTLVVVARFVFIVASLVTFAALAQQTDADQQSWKPSVVVTRGTGGPSRAWQYRASLRPAKSQDLFGSGLRTAKTVFSAEDAQDASFLPPVSYDAWCLPWSVAVGDVNGDGHPDLVVANWYQDCSGVFSTGAVSVLLGNGDGTYQAPVSYASGGVQALGVAIGDLNGDGKLDLVVANSCGANSGTCDGQVGVLLGNGDGTFQPAVSYFSGDALAYSVTIADVNGDGRPDIVAANYCYVLVGGGCTNPGSAGVLLGNGDGTFQPGVRYAADAGSNIVSLAVGDLNGDGHPDVVMVGGEDVGTISVLLGNGDGTFKPEVSYNWGGYEPNSVAIADVNGDGHPDVVVASYCQDLSGDCSSGNLAVLLGTGDGTLQAPANYSAGGFNATSVVIADVNADAHPDLIVATSDPNGPGNSGPGAVGVLVGNGDGTFQAAEVFPSGGGAPISVAVADVNGDSKPDVLVANMCNNGSCTGKSPGMIGVLLNDAGIPQSPTTTTMVCSPTHSGYGQTVTCTATVNASLGAPTGTTILYDGATPIASAKLANRKAVMRVASLAVGTHSLMAVYQGASGFAPSTSPSLTQVVVAAPTTVSVTSSANPALVGQLVTFTATVIGQYRGGTATGTVAFQNGGRTVATVPVNRNRASYSKAFPGRRVRSITATYSGDSNNRGSTSPTFNEAIGSLPYSSTTRVATSGSPSLVGQPITFTATVTFVGNAIPDGALVTFYDGSSEIGTSTTASGVAAFITSSLSAKTHTIKATYAGDMIFKPSTGTVTQVVNKYATTIALTSSPNPSSYDQLLTFTATVTPTGPYPLTNAVTFRDGTLAIGTATLSGGVATVTRRKLAVGTHSITATYVGDAFNAKSVSAAITQTVRQASISMGLTSYPNPSTFGTSVKFTARLTSNGGLPSGQPVAFSYNGATLGTANVNSYGVATFYTTALPRGSDLVTAAYAGTVDYSPASATVTQVVN